MHAFQVSVPHDRGYPWHRKQSSRSSTYHYTAYLRRNCVLFRSPMRTEVALYEARVTTFRQDAISMNERTSQRSACLPRWHEGDRLCESKRRGLGRGRESKRRDLRKECRSCGSNVLPLYHETFCLPKRSSETAGKWGHQSDI